MPTTAPAIPRPFARRLAAGGAAGEWVATLPDTATRLAEQWGVRLDGFLRGGTTSCCFAGEDSRGRGVVLKLLPPSLSAVPEVAALREWRGAGAMEVLASSVADAAVLLERALPGTPLRAGDDIADSVLAVRTLVRLHHPEGALEHDCFPDLDAAVERRLALGRSLNLPAAPGWERRFREAERTAVTLLRTTPRPDRVLLHGDAISRNLLWHGPGLRVIDPMPHLGDRAFDLALWAVLHRPLGGWAARLETVIAHSAADPVRCRRWAFVLMTSELCALLAAAPSATAREAAGALRAWSRGKAA